MWLRACPHATKEWELKVLPIAVTHFERARSIEINGGGVMTRRNASPRRKTSVDKHKLSVTYQFIRAMPEVFEGASRFQLVA
jgi:hypothetical protein